MRVWIKNFDYHKNKGYQFFESEICTDKMAMGIEGDFEMATQFVSMSEFLEIEKQLSDLQEKYDRAVEVARFYGDINNWTGEDINGWNCTNVIRVEDQETLEAVWVKGCDTEADVYDDCGGKKAREFLKSIESNEVQFEPCGKCLCKCACEEEDE